MIEEIKLTLNMTGILALLPGKNTWDDETVGDVTVACVEDWDEGEHSPALIGEVDGRLAGLMPIEGWDLRVVGLDDDVKPTDNLKKYACRSAWAHEDLTNAYENPKTQDAHVMATALLQGGSLDAGKWSGQYTWRFLWGIGDWGPEDKRVLAETLVYEVEIRIDPNVGLQLWRPREGGGYDEKFFRLYPNDDEGATVWLVNLSHASLFKLYAHVNEGKNFDCPEKDPSFKGYFHLRREKITRKRIPHRQEGGSFRTASGPFCPSTLFER